MTPSNDQDPQTLRPSDPQTLTPLNRSRFRRAGLYLATIGACLLFVLLSIKLAPPAQAQAPTCTPTPTITPVPGCTPQVYGNCGATPVPTPPNPSPAASQIPAQYQPQGHDGTDTVLYWRAYVPDDGNSSWPTILIIHEGHFASGSIYSGTLDLIAKDLRDAGYFVLIGDHRLAPCGLIKGQTAHDNTPAGKASGRPAQQKNDIKSLIAAARNDSRCNGKLGVLGGSSGATHAAWVAIDQTVSTVWPIWNKDLRPDAVVCRSGNYDFSDRTASGTILTEFVKKVENYTNTCDPSEQRDLSIVRLIETSPTDIKPIFAINSDQDTMPVHEIVDLQCALQNRGVSSNLYQLLTIGPDNHNHAFGYYYDWDGVVVYGQPFTTVAMDVNGFLNLYLRP